MHLKTRFMAWGKRANYLPRNQPHFSFFAHSWKSENLSIEEKHYNEQLIDRNSTICWHGNQLPLIKKRFITLRRSPPENEPKSLWASIEIPIAFKIYANWILFLRNIARNISSEKHISLRRKFMEYLNGLNGLCWTWWSDDDEKLTKQSLLDLSNSLFSLSRALGSSEYIFGWTFSSQTRRIFVNVNEPPRCQHTRIRECSCQVHINVAFLPIHTKTRSRAIKTTAHIANCWPTLARTRNPIFISSYSFWIWNSIPEPLDRNKKPRNAPV